MGYVGAEMIRRTLGLARVAELESLDEAGVRIRARVASVETGRELIKRHSRMDRFAQALAVVHRIVEGLG